MPNTTRDPTSTWGLGRALCASLALIALPMLSGCAQSAARTWAQNSAAIAPSQRPHALSAFSAVKIERDDEIQ